MNSINMPDNFNCSIPVDLKVVKNCLHTKASLHWKNELYTKPKLRTYVQFKECFEVENYVKLSHHRLQRSLIAQLRSGTLPLNLEIGRFRNLNIEDRLCSMCNNNAIENEFHFVCECPAYNDCRSIMYESIRNSNTDFGALGLREKFQYIMKSEWKILGKYLQTAWEIRTRKLYI